MAWTDFYIQSGGANANSGTTTGAPVWSNTASVVWTGSTTSTLATTDLNAVNVQVGDYINVGGTWVSKVTANSGNVGGTVTITLSGTTGWGTEPSSQTYSTNGQVVDGGPWADPTQGILTASTTVPSSTRINIKGWNGSSQIIYSLSGNLSLSLTAATTKPLWYRGYNTTPGDLDNGSTSLTYPAISQSTNTLSVTSSFTLLSGMIFSGSVAGNLVSLSLGSQVELRHCQFNNTSTSGSAVTFNISANGSKLVNCWFQGASASAKLVSATGTSLFTGCYFNGANAGSTQIGLSASSTITVDKCTFYQTGSHGISASAVIIVKSCTFYRCGGDSIHLTGIGSNLSVSGIDDCTFFNSGGYDINNASGTNTAVPYLWNNLSYSPTSGHLNGFGDWAELNPLTDNSQSYVSSTDLHLAPASAGAGAALPGQWENVTSGLTSTPDVGAWQRNAGGVPVGQQCT